MKCKMQIISIQISPFHDKALRLRETCDLKTCQASKHEHRFLYICYTVDLAVRSQNEKPEYICIKATNFECFIVSFSSNSKVRWEFASYFQRPYDFGMHKTPSISNMIAAYDVDF